MPELRALLDRAAGDPPDLPDFDVILERGRDLRRRRRVLRALGSMAAGVLLAATVSSLWQPDEGRLILPAPQTSPSRPVVTNACPSVGTDASGEIAITLARRGLTSAVHVIPAGGGAGRCVVDTAGDDSAPAWSPDGQWLAFIGGDGTRDDLFVVRADGSDLTRLTDSQAIEVGPVWSPDGDRLGFTVMGIPSTPTSIHVLERDGRSGEVVLVGPARGVVILQDWSPDGGTLLFTRDTTSEGGHLALWSMAPNGSEQQLLRIGAGGGDVGSAARYSADGSQVAFQSDEDGGCIYRSDPTVQRVVKVTEGCSRAGSLSWSPDGSRLAVGGSRSVPANLVVVDVEQGRQRIITTGFTVSDVDWRPASAE